jgi:hypothetical protein
MCHPASADDLRKLSNLLDSANFARFSKEHARSLNAELSVHFGDMCLGGEIEAARLFVSAGSAVTDLATYYGNDNAEAPIAVQPLFQAVAGGSVDTARWLLKLGADVNAQASDGTTPFLVACQEGDLQVVQLLCEHGGNMIASDQDGMTPALIAAASGHVDVIRFLHENGVDLQSPGHIYADEGCTDLRRNVTPLTVARDWGQDEVAAYLVTSFASQEGKRVRSEEPMLERARKAGVANRLKPIPASLLAAAQPGSGTCEEIQAAKKQLKALQIANQQIVSRAEKAQLKQVKLI